MATFYIVCVFQRCPQPSPDLLLTIPEISQVAPNLFTETSPPRTVRPPTIPSQEFSSTTSIAPRERPKASSANPSGNLIVLAGSVNLKLANGVAVPLASSQPLGSADQSQRKNSMSNSRPGNGGFGGENVDQVFSGSPFKPVAGAVNPFRPSGEVGNSDWVTPFPRPEVPVILFVLVKNRFWSQGYLIYQLVDWLIDWLIDWFGASLQKPRMGHRRNTSDTSMVPATRPLSPTPTQNISEKSRSADTSPHRSPLHPGGDVEKKFSNWNPFDDSEVWAHLPAPPTISSAGLAQSISSLVRGGSISSASRTTLASPTGESGDKVRVSVHANIYCGLLAWKFYLGQIDSVHGIHSRFGCRSRPSPDGQRPAPTGRRRRKSSAIKSSTTIPRKNWWKRTGTLIF